MRLKRTGILTKIVLGVVFVYALVMLVRLNDQNAEAKSRLDDYKRQEAALAADVDKMTYDLEHRNDPEVIEDIAREHGYINPGESIYKAS